MKKIGGRIGGMPPALRQTLAYALGLVLTKCVSLLMIPVVTHHLTPADYGTLEVIVTFANVGGIVAAFGLVEALYRFAGPLADTQARGLMAARIFGLALTLGVILGVALQASAPFIAAKLPGDVSVLQLRLISLSVTLSTCVYLPYAWLRMCNRAGTFLAFSVAKAGSQAGLVALALSQGYGVTGMLAATASVDVVVAVLFVWRQARDTGVRLPTSDSLALLFYGGPLVLGGFALFFIGSFDFWLLARFVGTAALAEYALAVKFAVLTGLLMQPFELWWFPRRIGELQSGDGIARSARVVGAGIVLAIFAATAVAVAAPIVIRLLTPFAYHGAIQYVPWLVAIAALQSIGNLVNVGCYSRETGAQPMTINLGAAAVALAGYFTLIPSFGIAGTIVATLAAQLTRLALFHHYSQRTARLPYRMTRLVLIAVAATLALTAVNLLDDAASRAAAGAVALAALATLAVTLGAVPPLRSWARPAPGSNSQY